MTDIPAQVGAPAEVEGQPAPAEAGAAPTQEDDVRLCEVPDCDNQHSGRGRCALHYGRARLGDWLDEDPEGDLKRWDERQARIEAERQAAQLADSAPELGIEPEGPDTTLHQYDQETTDDEPSVEDLAVGGTDPADEPLAPECDGDNDQDVCTEPELGGDCVGNDCDGSQLEEAPGEAEPPKRLWAVLQEVDAPFDGPVLITVVEATDADAALYFGLAVGEEPAPDRFARPAGIDDVNEYVARHTRVNRALVQAAEERAMRAELQVAALRALQTLPVDASASGVHTAAWRKLRQLLSDIAYSGRAPEIALAAK